MDVHCTVLEWNLFPSNAFARKIEELVTHATDGERAKKKKKLPSLYVVAPQRQKYIPLKSMRRCIAISHPFLKKNSNTQKKSLSKKYATSSQHGVECTELLCEYVLVMRSFGRRQWQSHTHTHTHVNATFSAFCVCVSVCELHWVRTTHVCRQQIADCNIKWYGIYCTTGSL